MSEVSLEERKRMLFAYRQTGAFAKELKALLPPPRPLPAYAFTEIRTFHISEDATIETDVTSKGKIWAHTIRSYLEDEGTGLVWWGRLDEAPQVLKLVVDWKNIYQHHHFEESELFKEMERSWTELVLEPVTTRSYVLPDWEPTRQCAFSKSIYPPIISTILTFHFPPDFDPSPSKMAEWNMAWWSFSTATLKSAGGNVSSGTCSGWSLDKRSFVGIIRYHNVPSMKQYLEEAATYRVTYGGLARLKELASEGMDVEFAGMFCMKHGWLGSVAQTEKQDPNLQYMLGFFNRNSADPQEEPA